MSKSSVTFSDRLDAITKIQAAQLSLGKSSNESQQDAKLREGEAYTHARDQADYVSRIRYYVQKAITVPLQGVALQEAELDSCVGDLLPSGITIGQYTDATHYRDGIFSEVLKGRAPLHSHWHKKESSKHRIVAIKVTHPSRMEPPHDSHRESRLLRKAAGHHIIPLIESFTQSGGRFILVFPFMPYDLGQVLRERRLTPVQQQTCIRDMLSGLAHFHKLGIIHRDVKPSNILMQSLSGPAVIADFGIAWSSDEPKSESADSKVLDVGTTCYRPPELMFGNQSYGTSLDLWAAGCTVAQIVDLGAETLFDSGELGSDLALIKSIFETLGTPTSETWPEAKTYPDWGKMSFHEYPSKPWREILPNTSEQARDLVASLVKFESGARITADEALTHDYLRGNTSQ